MIVSSPSFQSDNDGRLLTHINNKARQLYVIDFGRFNVAEAQRVSLDLLPGKLISSHSIIVINGMKNLFKVSVRVKEAQRPDAAFPNNRLIITC